MQPKNIENTVVDEANHRTYVVLAPRVLSDGEIYQAIRQGILKRGGRPVAQGETLTLTLTLRGASISAVTEEKGPLSPPVPNLNEQEHFLAAPA